MAVSVQSDLKDFLVHLCADIAVFIRENLYKVTNSDIETKDENSLVSYVDKQAEQMIVSALRARTPDAGFITEEDTQNETNKSKIWIIDPLDGTTNFLRKIPHFSTSIALMEDGVITLGIVYEIMLDNAYTAIKGQGAWLNDKPISVSNVSELSKAMVVTGFPYRKDINMAANFEILKYCVHNCRGIRRLGSAALDLAYVAAGNIDIYYENSINIWDIAAGVLLVEEAGGKISDYQGGQNHLQKGSVISSNSFLYDSITPIILKAHS